MSAFLRQAIKQSLRFHIQKSWIFSVSNYFLVSIAFTLLMTTSFKSSLFAHHLRAGDVTARLVSCQSNTYIITVTGYTDTRIGLEFGYEILDMGDGTYINLDTCEAIKKDLGENVTVKVIQIEHTFPGPGEYTIRYHEPNRNDGVLNMDNSGYTAFYVDAQITIDPYFYCNNTPVFLNPPIDRGAIGIPYLHNPAAWDQDGDSLVYKLIPCKRNVGLDVLGFEWPDIYDIAHANATNAAGNGPATFTMDPISGDIVWDAPAIEGQYNVAFIVEEWRKVDGEWFKLGYITRDMQILIKASENHPPKLILPPDTCVEAGTTLNVTIMASDPDDHDILIETYSGIYSLFGGAVSYSPNPFEYQPNPARMHLEWQTSCNQVREKPYQVIFKAKDNPILLSEQPPLVDMASWYVKIIPPAPKGVTTTLLPDNSVKLNWDSYACSNAERIQIWRRIDGFDLEEGACLTGIPENSGYELIGEVSHKDTVFFDTNDQTGLAYGAKYCYRLTAVFPPPMGGESYPSEEVCIIIKEDPSDKRFGPVITHVDVENTDISEGQIRVRWTSPLYIDTTAYPAPFTYELLRAEGYTGTLNLTSVTNKTYTDTVFIDSSINTRNKIYNYHIVVYDANGEYIAQSAAASSVRLGQSPVDEGIALHWKANVPWSNQVPDYPYHYIHRNYANPDNPDQLYKIDSVDVIRDGFVYQDKGQFNGEPVSGSLEYRYYVTTLGSYGNPDIESPLFNRSQILFIRLEDSISNCIPISLAFGNITSPEDCRVFIQDKPCDFKDFQNELHWQIIHIGNCENTITSFNIYFSETGQDGSFKKIANTTDTFFIHKHLPMFAGCYKVSAVNSLGEESALSDMICHDNCPYYELPNVFTPNNDGKNDVFKAFDEPESKCPRFVKSVIFKVYNRYGIEIYNSLSQNETNSIYINWDGCNTTGIPLPSGVYFYTAHVEFNALDPALSTQTFKGWVSLMK